MIAFTLFKAPGEANQRILPTEFTGKQVSGLIVVGQSNPVIIYQK
jgi:hypothetical protein